MIQSMPNKIMIYETFVLRYTQRTGTNDNKKEQASGA